MSNIHMYVYNLMHTHTCIPVCTYMQSPKAHIYMSDAYDEYIWIHIYSHAPTYVPIYML